MIMRSAVVIAALACAACASCTAAETPNGAAGASLSPTPSRQSPTPVKEHSAHFEADRAVDTVRALAGRIGRREATSGAFDRAADLVAARFTQLGYHVAQPTFRVPAGVSWWVPVPAGTSRNVIAMPKTLEPGDRHVIIGAHLDTVPQAPGAEDNASGVSVMLELARVAASEGTRLPVVFVAFGAEEPRGSGDDMHHFGSREFTAGMSGRERRSLVAMVSLDRVGVGDEVPVCDGGLTGDAVVRDLRAAGRRADVPTSSCGVNQSSDHWSFERAGLPAARLGSTAYDAYHSSTDRPRVVQSAQLQRTGDLAWAFIAAR